MPPMPIRVSTRALLGAGAAAILAVTGGEVTTGAASARAPAAASVSVTPSTVTRPIAPDFLGLALEFSTVPSWVGSGAPDPVLLHLIRNLTPTGRPSIRIGGLSTDRTWWPAQGLRPPKGVTYALSAGWSQRLTALARALDARLILGVNFEADDRGVAGAEARALQATIPARYLSLLDLGNETPLYTSVPWYRISGGTLLPWYSTAGQAVFSRAPSWGPASFVRDYDRILGALPQIPIAGPDTQNVGLLRRLWPLLSPRSHVRMLTSHGYGLNTCVTDSHVPTYPTIAHLLNRYALDDLLAGLSPSIAAAHRTGASFRIDEMGSVTCGGYPGVSDTMAAALWAAQALFSVARAGVDGVNLHTYPGLSNALYDIGGRAGGLTARRAPAVLRRAAVRSRGAHRIATGEALHARTADAARLGDGGPWARSSCAAGQRQPRSGGDGDRGRAQGGLRLRRGPAPAARRPERAGARRSVAGRSQLRRDHHHRNAPGAAARPHPTAARRRVPGVGPGRRRRPVDAVGPGALRLCTAQRLHQEARRVRGAGKSRPGEIRATLAGTTTCAAPLLFGVLPGEQATKRF